MSKRYQISLIIFAIEVQTKIISKIFTKNSLNQIFVIKIAFQTKKIKIFNKSTIFKAKSRLKINTKIAIQI
jgi:ribosomal protein L25 (general stress protein Ctc)